MCDILHSEAQTFHCRNKEENKFLTGVGLSFFLRDNNFIKDFPQLADGLMVIPLPVEEQCRGVLSEPFPNLQLLTGKGVWVWVFVFLFLPVFPAETDR